MKKKGLLSFVALGFLAITLSIQPANLFSSSVIKHQLQELNRVVTDLLNPWDSLEDTSANILFREIETRDDKVTLLDLKSEYSKTGPITDFALKVEGRYEYESNYNNLPLTTLAGTTEFDLLKFFEQEMINEIGPILDVLLKDLASQYVDTYGEAITFDAQITNTEFDDDENLISLALMVDIKFDLSKLQEPNRAEDILFTSLILNSALTLNSISISGKMVSNPSYEGFGEEQRGLKDFVDGLLNNDPEILEMLTEYIEYLDETARELVGSEE